MGNGKATSGANYSYHCPFCNHRKPKLEINFRENEEGLNNWHCWVCNRKGKTVFGHERLHRRPLLIGDNIEIYPVPIILIKGLYAV